MTAQIPDTFVLDGKVYALVGQRGSTLFEPGEHGVDVRPMHTACRRGYIATYSITDAVRLVEVELQMAEPDRGRTLFGVRPKKYKDGRATYRKLEQVVEFSGGLLLGDDLVQELAVHMGFQRPYKWRVVHEVIVERGHVVERHDRSDAMAAIREKLAGRPLSPGRGSSDAEIEAWIKDSFRLDY
jgi:hypothetical protein